MSTPFRDLINDLKRNSPAKFLEVLPDLMTTSIARKLPQLGFSPQLSQQIISTNEKIIDKKLRSDYNLYSVGIGAIIFIVGSILAANSRKSTEKEV